MKIEITLAGNPVAYLDEFGKYSKLARTIIKSW